MGAIFRTWNIFARFKITWARNIRTKTWILIMAFPSGNYNLAGALPEALFPDVPVVFVSVNELEVPYAISKLGVTGIVHATTFEAHWV